MHPNLLAIFTEAGEGIGFGHLMRCRALADAFREIGWEIKIYLYWIGEDLPSDADLTPYNWHQEPIPHASNTAGLALVDSYLASAEVYAAISKTYTFVCAIDDYNRLVYPVSLLLNPGITNGLIDYSKQQAPVLEGKSFILLRKEVRLAKLNNQSVHPELRVITITVGGSDVHQLLPRLGKVVLQICPQAFVRVILPDVTQARALKSLLPGLEVLGRQTAAQMIEGFQGSDLVISACGQTLHELSCLGTPFIGILTGEDQLYNQAYYLQNQALKEALRYNDPDLELKLETQLRLFEAQEIRRRMSENLPQLVSVNGASNARDALIKASQN